MPKLQERENHDVTFCPHKQAKNLQKENITTLNPKPYLIKCITKSRQQQDILYQNYKEIRCDQKSTRKSWSRKIHWPSGKMGSWKSFHIHHQVKPAQKTSPKTIRWGLLDKSCTRHICVHSCLWRRGWNHQLKVWTQCISKEGRDHKRTLRC